MNWKQFSISVLLFVLIFGALPVSAQEVDNGLDTGEYVLNIWQIVGGVITAVSVGGLMGIAGAGVLAARLRRDEATITAIERLADSVPSKIVDTINEASRSLREIAALLIEATDRIPARDKPPEANEISKRALSAAVFAYDPDAVPPPETVPSGALGDSSK